jgi:hypothetical protein
MKRSAVLTATAAAFALVAGAAAAHAQVTFKVPFKFEAAGKKCAAGDYAIAGIGDGRFTLKQVSTGKEIQVPFQKKLAPPDPPITEPRLVFDEVGNFEPSYTEYFTVYILAEVWPPGEKGLEVHVTKGAHKTQVVTGQPAAK